MPMPLSKNQLPNMDALKTALQQFNHVAADASYRGLSQRAEFQATHESLRQYIQQLKHRTRDAAGLASCVGTWLVPVFGRLESLLGAITLPRRRGLTEQFLNRLAKACRTGKPIESEPRARLNTHAIERLAKAFRRDRVVTDIDLAVLVRRPIDQPAWANTSSGEQRRVACRPMVPPLVHHLRRTAELAHHDHDLRRPTSRGLQGLPTRLKPTDRREAVQSPAVRAGAEAARWAATGSCMSQGFG